MSNIGLLSLESYNEMNAYFTLTTEDNKKMITYFKAVYKRHTTFSIEPYEQKFTNEIEFGKRCSCTIHTMGDLISKIYLIINLPKINVFYKNNEIDNITKFAWVKNIGFSIIKYVEIEIGNKIIDKQYGEWLYIWHELTKTDINIDNMIGNIPELYDYSSSKDEYKLYIPLNFWFCKSYSNALPINAMQAYDIRINFELNEFEKCANISPNNYIKMYNGIINFEENEIIEQIVNNKIITCIFNYYDEYNSMMYYTVLSSDNLSSLIYDDFDYLSDNDKNNIIYNADYDEYFIFGKKSLTKASIYPNSVPNKHNYEINNISINECFLLINYITLSSSERKKIMNTHHEKVIEQISYINEQYISSSNKIISINSNNLTKMISWVSQYEYIKNNNDHYNYTNNCHYTYDKCNDNAIIENNSIIINESMLFEYKDRISEREYKYFNYIQQYQHDMKYVEGLNIYSYALFPKNIIPSGSVNLTKINNLSIKFNFDKDVSIKNKIVLRIYLLKYNILIIKNGICYLKYDYI
jgi:hypothetical protein